mmetsp:Transcript_56910/g.64935  ORF Transcript_56910/g.64935 Transcript_56910/m.64935 type:complete len:122 (-) Transcript_56910:237-602(-)|eukprot:CAMPEP_0115009952 /NCGR_PEP_ID=MMETSP0216-20121206/22975_1 /TAXON_ID=223996 /ORGANISM="Protocruzia adherens, Strain Boccale" /LENGTH=121 /DNA_ID=CAMNT_0002377971 /DNA_START=36 /DNA_END=401 /DNA_ORIENTATION=-
MKILNEDFNYLDYEMSGVFQVQTLEKTNTDKLKELPFKIQEYAANNRFHCFSYERGVRECLNTYGNGEEFQKQKGCLDLSYWFDGCVRTHSFFGYHKKYFEDQYKTNKYTRPVPHRDDLFL